MSGKVTVETTDENRLWDAAFGEGEDAEGHREEGEEGRKPVSMRSPENVSQAERDEHNLTHTPYRNWCPHCVRARVKTCRIRK